MESINSKLFVLYEILNAIQNHEKWDKNNIERTKKGEFINLNFLGISTHSAFFSIQSLLQKNIIKELKIIQYEWNQKLGEEREFWHFFPKDVKKEILFSLIPIVIILNKKNSLSYAIKADKNKVINEIETELTLWKKGKGIRRKWKCSKQIDTLIQYILEENESFPLDQISIYYNEKRFSYIDFMAVLLDLEKNKYCNIRAITSVMISNEKAHQQICADIELLPRFVREYSPRETFQLKGKTLIYDDKYLDFQQGCKLAFLQKLNTIKPFTRVLKDEVEISVYGDKGQGSRLKSLIGKINMDIHKEFEIKTAFSIEGDFIRRSF